MFPQKNLANEHVVLDICCGENLLHQLQRAGLYVHLATRIGWRTMRRDRSILRYCQRHDAVLVTKDHNFANRARVSNVRVIELWNFRGMMKATEEAYVVLAKLGCDLTHFMLITGIHFGLMFNITVNSKRGTCLRTSNSKHNRIKGTDPLFQLPIGNMRTRDGEAHQLTVDAKV